MTSSLLSNVALGRHLRHILFAPLDVFCPSERLSALSKNRGKRLRGGRRKVARGACQLRLVIVYYIPDDISRGGILDFTQRVKVAFICCEMCVLEAWMC